MGFDEQFAAGITRPGQLFEKLAKARHAIAHFLVEDEEGESHVYLADGRGVQQYARGASALLRYAIEA